MMSNLPPLQAEYNPDAFRAWLREFKGAADVVGYAGKQGSCPLSNWLSDEHLSGVLVDYDEIEIGDTLCATPRWAYEFQLNVDGRDGKAITRRQALNCLTRAEKNADV